MLAEHIARHVQRVDAAIGELRRRAGLRGIVAPAHARIVGVGGVGVEAVREFRLDEPDLAEIAARDHRPHVADQRIAGIAVVDRERNARRARRRDVSVLGLLERHRHRLFAQHRDARFEERLGDFVVRGVRRGDGDEIDAVGAIAFARQHLAPVAIGALGCDAEVLREGAALGGVGVERAGGEFIEPVDAGAEPMRGADLAAFAAADEAPVQLHARLLQRPAP